MPALLPAWASPQLTGCRGALVYATGSLQTDCLARVSHQHRLLDVCRCVSPYFNATCPRATGDKSLPAKTVGMEAAIGAAVGFECHHLGHWPRIPPSIWWRCLPDAIENTPPGRRELPTLRLTASRSNPLSYGSLCWLRATTCLHARPRGTPRHTTHKHGTKHGLRQAQK